MHAYLFLAVGNGFRPPLELNLYVKRYAFYVNPCHTGIADFRADSVDAAYTACADGEITGDDHGCITDGTNGLGSGSGGIDTRISSRYVHLGQKYVPILP